MEDGVDLNRNYDFKFGYDDDGSSPMKCREDYRGEKPFSEPETQAIKNFIENHKGIKMAANFHAYGNLWITPYNFLKDAENPYLSNTSSAYHIYNEFFNEANFSSSAK